MSIAKPVSAQASALVWAELIVLGAIWGGAFFFGKVAVAEVTPLALVLARVSIAAATLLAVLFWTMRSELATAARCWPAFLVLGLLNNVIPFSLIFAGQTEIGSGLASILNATTPLWTALAANVLTDDDRLTANRMGGIVLGLAGLVVMIGLEPFEGLGGPVWPKLAIVGAAISYAFAAIFARRFRAMKPQAIAVGQLTASSVIMLPVVLVAGGFGSLAAAGTASWMSILGLAVISTALAYILYFDIIGKAGATNASLVTLIIPLFALLLGTALLGERLEARETAGMVLIGLGLLLFDGRILRLVLPSPGRP